MYTDVRQAARPEVTEEGFAAEMQAYRLQSFLKGRREHLNLRQIQVAERLDISERAYGNWERGQVKEWTDEKLYALAEALEMSEYQITRLFLYAAGRAPQPDLRAAFRWAESEDPAVASFLSDGSGLLTGRTGRAGGYRAWPSSPRSSVAEHAWPERQLECSKGRVSCTPSVPGGTSCAWMPQERGAL